MNIIGGRDTLHPFAYAFLSACDYKNTLFSYEINAINEYVKTLVGYNVWDKLVGLYPFVGRTAKLHSLNLKCPTKYNIWWCGTSLTHDAMGVHGNSAGFGNTLIALNQFRSCDIHLSVYNATYWADANPVDYLIGATDGFAGNRIALRTTVLDYTYDLGDDSVAYYSPINNASTPDTSYIAWEDFKSSNVWDVDLYGAAKKYQNGYFGGELANEQVASQVYGHIIGSKSQVCYLQGERFGNVAPSVIPYHSVFLIESDANYNNGCMAPILLFRNGKFGKVGSAFSRANIRMASVGYGLSDFQASLFFEATQSFQAALGRDVDRLYLGQSDILGADSAIILQSFENLSTDIGVLPYDGSYDGAVLKADITMVTIVGPRVVAIADTPLDASVDIISFTES